MLWRRTNRRTKKGLCDSCADWNDYVCGDYVLVKKQNTAINGEIVVALIGDEATVKTFYKEKDHIRLQPQNSTMDPIIVPTCEILGKVAGVFRKL